MNRPADLGAQNLLDEKRKTWTKSLLTRVTGEDIACFLGVAGSQSGLLQVLHFIPALQEALFCPKG